MWVPSGATILAGVNLERVRASSLRPRFPAAARTFIDSLGGAGSVLVASDGSDFLVLTRYANGQAPSGATLLGPGLAALGTPGWLRAATSQRRHRAADTNSLMERAEPLAAAAGIWVVAAGNAHLPVSGNGENLNRLLHATEYATLSVRLTDRIALDAVGTCSGPESARHLEETVRAYLALGAAGTARQPALSGLLRQVRVDRDDRAVRLTLVAQASQLEPLYKLF